MTEIKINSNFSKSKGLLVLEYFLLVLCLCVLALRSTFSEGINVQSASQMVTLTNCIYSLSMSAVLILAFALWLIVNIWSGRFRYRFSSIEIGLCLFALAAVISGVIAANKRLAITDFVTIVAPILMAVMLVQILDCHAKIKLVLIVVVALGVVSAYRCSEQFYENEQLIEFYESDPTAVLARQNITPESLEHWQFEHRLYSKDIRGFFLTGNSAGSFSMLALFAAIALFFGKFKYRKSDPSGFAWLTIGGIAVVVIFAGLVITFSKGAIAASVIALAMFIGYLLFGRWLKGHRKLILIVCILLALTGGVIIVSYGLRHGRLPGGSSMLVRWQYWDAAVRMYGEHWLSGVGPGNFVHFYPHYKISAAVETVADPHSFVLSIITQYGPIGLVGFLAVFCIPLCGAVFSKPTDLNAPQKQSKLKFGILIAGCLIVVSIVLLFIRPMLFSLPPARSAAEANAAILILYIMPVIVFILAFLLLAAGEKTDKLLDTNVAIAALFCGCVGCLIHNLLITLRLGYITRNCSRYLSSISIAFL